jgi:hypothetical protein
MQAGDSSVEHLIINLVQSWPYACDAGTGVTGINERRDVR